MIACHQCGKPALYTIEDEKIPLCLDCFERHQNLIQRQLEESARVMNYATGQMELLAGLPPGSLGPRMHILSAPQPVTFNNIRIDRSNVGVVNTGQAGRIDAVVTYSEETGHPELAKALADFTQAVVDSKDVEQATRDAIIEQLSFLASQTATEKKQPSITSAVFSGLEKTIRTVSGLIKLWEQLGPLLKNSLGL